MKPARGYSFPILIAIIDFYRPTARVSGRWVGQDSPSKRKKLKATKMSENAARTHRRLHPVLGGIISRLIFWLGRYVHGMEGLLDSRA